MAASLQAAGGAGLIWCGECSASGQRLADPNRATADPSLHAD
ncbi:hypothetical protein FM104_02730 [Microbacterium esteraromaticum]|uniref:Uncharacterized protein n=1 Tax=Microbacterium esteraromaticum TaxID=57043 RepID=A0A1R4IN03_9MICO|nr:hypothetical protein FM104_02730 [Microbacterium esteraromaticum]